MIMKQVVQNYHGGKLRLVDVPVPLCPSDKILVKNRASLISIGTERSVIELGEKSLLGKAIARPDLVKQFVSKVKAEGFSEAYNAAMARLDHPVPLGYSCAGIVVETGSNVGGISKGDGVACVGSGYASHAEFVCVPESLCVRIPENVDFKSASFAALGGIALQALRVANVSPEDNVAVIGLGLLGQLVVQLLKANGCHVFGIDVLEERISMALQYGAEGGGLSGKADILPVIRGFAPKGFDSVIIMAAADSNEPLETAAEIAGEKGRIIATGMVRLNIPRKAFFEKELELVVSRAWGSGALDPSSGGKNAESPHSRWTGKGNIEEFLSHISKGSVKVKHLVTHRFDIEKALDAYRLIRDGKESCIGVLLTYPSSNGQVNPADNFSLKNFRYRPEKPNKLDELDKPNKPGIGFIGAGLFATTTLLPILKSSKDLRLKGVATASGVRAQHIARKFGFEYFTTDYKKLLQDQEIDLVCILTRHDSHAPLVKEGLEARKNIFVEKPLCLDESQLREIISTYQSLGTHHESAILMVGFNRRFSPLSVWLKEKFKLVNEPLSIHCTVNAGYLPPDHWTHDPKEGGGRIIGEVCHFIDLIQYLTGSLPSEVFAESTDSKAYQKDDNVSITLKMRNGSIASILYVASGNKHFQRERVEVFGGGVVGIINNFKEAVLVEGRSKKRMRNWFDVDRGHREEMKILQQVVCKRQMPPVSLEEYVYVSLATFAAERSLRDGKPVQVILEERPS
jgi:predicted dehydrogenase